MFVVDDRRPAGAGAGAGGAAAERSATAALGPRRPAWADPADDEGGVDLEGGAPRLRKLRQAEGEVVRAGEYQARLRERHVRLHPEGGQEWARLTGSGDRDGAAEPANITHLEEPREPSALPAGEVELIRLKDANRAEPSGGVVQSVHFHPDGGLLLTGGLDRKLRFFRVDGAENPKAASAFLEDLPVRRAAFVGDGGRTAVCAGRRPFYYAFDVESQQCTKVRGIMYREERSLEEFVASPPGAEHQYLAFLCKGGVLSLVSARNHMWVADLKMPAGAARTATFSACGRYLMASGTGGTVSTWDLRTRTCVGRMVDSGCLNGSALAASPEGGLFASGSTSGVVNVYDRKQALAAPGAKGRHTVFEAESEDLGTAAAAAARVAMPRLPSSTAPLWEMMNLTTKIDTLTFNPDGQMLAAASSMKRNALRLLHVPSRTVFSNWPTSKTPLHYVHSLAFSPGSDMLAVGNARGRVLLYRLKHYSRDD